MSGNVLGLLRERRTNAALAWVVVALLAAVVVGSTLDGRILWALFAGTLLTLALLPPLTFRSRGAMLPWEILLLAALPVVGRLFATVTVTGNLATYLSVAAIALIVAVELHIFTPVRMTPRFAVVFVGIATMAAAGFWAIVRWSSDRLLGTTFILDPALTEHAIEEALMWEFVASTIAGLGAGVVFAYYVRRELGRARVSEGVTTDS